MLSRCFIAILLTGALIQSSQQACLTAAQLSALGFTASANATTGTSSVCSNLYSNGGNCINPADIQAFFSINQANLQANANLTVRLNNVLSSFTNILNNAINGASNLTSTLGNLTKNLTSNLNTSFNATVNATAKASAKRRLQSSDSNTVASLRTIIQNAQSSVNACYQSYQNLVNGLYCYLTSSQATNNTSVTTDGSTTRFVVSVDTVTTSNALDACSYIIDAFCTMSYGVSISANISASAFSSIAAFGSSSNSVSLATCNSLKSDYNCGTSACKLNIRNTLINSVFNPTGIAFVQSSAFLSTQETLYSNLGGVATTLAKAFGRRLQANPKSNSNVYTSSSGSGEGVANDGQNSGAPTTTYGSSAKLFGVAFAFLVTILFA